jgi:hypothetical protein
VRDWQKFVRDRLDLGSLDRAQQDEIAVEMAAHLEDFCEDRRGGDSLDPQAASLAHDQVSNWNTLSRRIRRAKRVRHAMNDRTRRVWLPGLASLTAGNLLLMALSCASMHPRMVNARSTAWPPEFALMAAYAPWVAAQPLVGALGAWLSKRAGGGRIARLWAGLFPSIVMLACWGLVIPASAALDGHVWAVRHPAYFALGAFLWVAPAAMGLLFGCLPFLRMPEGANMLTEPR